MSTMGFAGLGGFRGEGFRCRGIVVVVVAREIQIVVVLVSVVARNGTVSGGGVAREFERCIPESFGGFSDEGVVAENVLFALVVHEGLEPDFMFAVSFFVEAVSVGLKEKGVVIEVALSIACRLDRADLIRTITTVAGGGGSSSAVVVVACLDKLGFVGVTWWDLKAGVVDVSGRRGETETGGLHASVLVSFTFPLALDVLQSVKAMVGHVYDRCASVAVETVLDEIIPRRNTVRL